MVRRCDIRDANGDDVLTTTPQCAAFIVLAVNSHAALVDALTMARAHIPAGAVHPVRVHVEPIADCQLINIVDAALSLARGGVE